MRRLDEEWDESIDRIPDEAFEKIAALIRALPPEFDVPSMQAHTRSVTCTIKFDGIVGPEAQAEAADRLFQAVTVIETLFINLRHERGLDA